MDFLSDPPGSPAVVTPRLHRAELEARFGPLPASLGDTALLALTPRDVRRAAQLTRRVSDGPLLLGTAELCAVARLGDAEGRPFALVGPAVGAPVAAIILELLATLGFRRVVAVGLCGSLQPDLPIGAAILPTSALREEGTSYHYWPTGVTVGPDATLAEALARALVPGQPSVRQGRVWTTDALYRETVGKVQRYRDAGVLAVDMEAAAVFAVARAVGLAAAALLVVSDELSTLAWQPGFRSPVFRAAHERLVAAALDFCATPAG